LTILLFLVIQSVSGCPPVAPTDGLHLDADFQCGFEGWKTFLFQEGELVYSGAPVTDPVVTLCGSVDLTGRSTLVEFELVVGVKGIDTTFTVDLSQGVHLGLSVQGEGGRPVRMILLQSATPFGYD